MFSRTAALVFSLALTVACGSTRGMGGPRSVGARSRLAVVSLGESRRFCIDRTPVTSRDYAYFVRDAHHRAPASDSQNSLDLAHAWAGAEPPGTYVSHPVVLVSWGDADAYCAWRGARLPTLHEWELAGEGPHHARWPWGEQYDPTRLNDRVHGSGDTTPVLSFPRGMSPAGLSDVLGNVLQWTSTSDGPDRFVAAGSAFDADTHDALEHTSLARDTRAVTLGFRCAAECSP